MRIFEFAATLASLEFIHIQSIVLFEFPGVADSVIHVLLMFCGRSF
jgi:hypothetical protein